MSDINDLERIRSGEGSKFNSAIADLERQHELIIAANKASIIGDYETWCASLNALYRELIVYADKKDAEELDKARVKSIPQVHKAKNIFFDRLDAYETNLRLFRAKKKLAIIADEDSSKAALR